MASNVSIVNGALVKLGEATINDFSEDNEPARVANRTYADIRDAVLREHHWGFATTRAALSANTTAPAFEFDNAYELPREPTYCLKVIDVENPNRYPWRVEGRQILTDIDAPLNVTFVYRNTDADSYDSLFIECLEARLAQEWAEPLTRQSTIAAAMAALYAQKLAYARSVDAQEQTPRILLVSSWLDARR